MKTIIDESFNINLNILLWLGLYPPERPTRLFRLYSYVVYFGCTYPLTILGVLYFAVEEEPQRVGANAFLIAETISNMTKLVSFVKDGDRIRECLKFLESPFFAVNKKHQKSFLRESVGICRRNSKIFLILVIFGWTSWASTPLLMGEKRLPLDVWPPLNDADDKGTYIFMYTFLSIGVAYCCLASASVDPLLGGVFCLASSYIKVLKDNLQHLDEYVVGSARTNKRSLLKNNIKKCVKLHDAILSFVEQLEECFSMVAFAQFFGSIPVICFCCFQLSNLSVTSFNFLLTISYLTMFLIQIYLYCYYGTVLYEESDTLIDAIYMGNWYEYDVETRKNLILVMERCKRPVTITAGKILDLSLATFTVLLQRSYSLLAVLKNNGAR